LFAAEFWRNTVDPGAEGPILSLTDRNTQPVEASLSTAGFDATYDPGPGDTAAVCVSLRASLDEKAAKLGCCFDKLKHFGAYDPGPTDDGVERPCHSAFVSRADRPYIAIPIEEPVVSALKPCSSIVVLPALETRNLPP
jgi:hypothetical protein